MTVEPGRPHTSHNHTTEIAVVVMEWQPGVHRLTLIALGDSHPVNLPPPRTLEER